MEKEIKVHHYLLHDGGCFTEFSFVSWIMASDLSRCCEQCIYKARLYIKCNFILQVEEYYGEASIKGSSMLLW